MCFYRASKNFTVQKRENPKKGRLLVNIKKIKGIIVMTFLFYFIFSEKYRDQVTVEIKYCQS